MGRGPFIIGLLLSLALHAIALVLPFRAPRAAIPAPAVATVIPILEPVPGQAETDVAAPSPPRPTPPRDAPAPVRRPAPEPAPEPEPEPEPTPAPTPGPVRPPGPSVAVDVAHAPRTETAVRGDFAGRPDGRTQPALRIDWGTSEQALAVLDAAGMQIVVLHVSTPEPVIAETVERTESAWVRRAFRPAVAAPTWSNQLRIVDDVPAFAGIRDVVGLRSDERLAVLVPLEIERRLDVARLEAAARHGVALEEIRSLAGRFALEGGAVGFDIVDVRW